MKSFGEKSNNRASQGAISNKVFWWSYFFLFFKWRGDHADASICIFVWFQKEFTSLVRSILVLLIFLFGLPKFTSFFGVDFKEDFFKSGHRDSVTYNVEIIHTLIKFSEELGELGCLVVVDLKRDFLRNFWKFFDLAKDFLQIGLNPQVILFKLFDHCEFVTSAESVLEEQWTA